MAAEEGSYGTDKQERGSCIYQYNVLDYAYGGLSGLICVISFGHCFVVFATFVKYTDGFLIFVVFFYGLYGRINCCADCCGTQDNTCPDQDFGAVYLEVLRSSCDCG